jgi:hypothetical protein
MSDEWRVTSDEQEPPAEEAHPGPGSSSGLSSLATRHSSLTRDAWGRLVLTGPDSVEHAGVVPVRAFPFSAPTRGIALCDPAGREVLWLDALEDLPPVARQLVEQELAAREFVPVIRAVRRVAPRIEPSEWDVETDRGAARFVLQSPDDVRRIDERRAMITDGHGVRYLINDLEALDPASRRILERYL